MEYEEKLEKVECNEQLAEQPQKEHEPITRDRFLQLLRVKRFFENDSLESFGIIVRNK